MSTVFDVFPRTKLLPTYGALLSRANTELHSFLGSVGISTRPTIQVHLRGKIDDAIQQVQLQDPLRWADDHYAWFFIDGVPGGTDAYFDCDGDEIRDSWQEDFKSPRTEPLQPLIQECLSVGHTWSFRRSAGQPGVIALAYGLIAGSLAEITGGLLHSIDSAWDYDRLPARGEDFLTFYFRPELALTESFREWSQSCIDGLQEELDSALSGGPTRNELPN